MVESPSEKLLKIFEQSIRGRVGASAVIDRCGENVRTPMSFTIERAVTRLEASAAIYWVSNGPPDMFCLRAAGSIAVAFGDRYVQLSSQFLQLLTMPMDNALRTEVAERLCLRVIAEFALKNGDADLAALCFMRAKAGERVMIGDTRDVMALEYEPINERYMFIWFFGLMHELGHAKAASKERRSLLANLFPDEWISSYLACLLEKEDLPINHRRSMESFLADELMFSPARLREESSADLFACEVLLETTRDILLIADKRQLNPLAFATEHVLATNWLSLIEKCRLIAATAPSRRPTGAQEIWKVALHYVAFHFRARVAQWYLTHALCPFAPGSTPETFEEAIDAFSEDLQPVLEAVQNGYRAAMRYTTKAKSQLDDLDLLELFRKQLTSITGGITMAETEAFIDRAKGIGARSQLLDQLEKVANEPNTPLESSGTGIHYLLAWIHGPNGLSVPFTVKTKYGPICFAFFAGNQSFDDFFKISAEGLLDCYQLKRCLINVPRPEALGEMILGVASDSAGFGLVWEGSEGFDELLPELISGEMFENE